MGGRNDAVEQGAIDRRGVASAGPFDASLASEEPRAEVFELVLVLEPAGFEDHGGAVLKMDEPGRKVLGLDAVMVPFAPPPRYVVILGEIEHRAACHPSRLGETHQPESHVQGMNANVHTGSPAAQGKIDEPSCRRHPIAPDGVNARMIDVAKRLAFEEAPDGDRRGGVALLLGGHHEKAGLVGGLPDAADGGGGGCQGFFAEYVFSGFQCIDRERGVEGVGRGDVNDVDLVELKQFPVILENAGDVEILRQFNGVFPVVVTHRDQLAVRNRQPARIEVRLAHDSAGTDESDL